MKRITLLLVTLVGLFVGPPVVFSDRSDRDFQTDVVNLTQRYCIDCHGTKKQSGSVNLEQYKKPSDVVKDRSTWETVIERVRNHEMPPKGKPQPTDAERKQLMAWIEFELSSAPCDLKPDPGRVTLRRLNRVEYANTVRDLFGMELNPADAFPLDDVGHGFDNIGDVLSITPLLMEKYMTAAEQILDQVFTREQRVKPTARLFQAQEREFRTSGKTKVLPDDQGRLLMTGNMIRSFRFEFPGEYRFKLRATGESMDDELPKVAFLVDGKEVQQIEIAPLNDKNAGRPGQRVDNYTVTAKVTSGDHSFGINVLNPKSDEATKKDRAVTIVQMELEGPLDLPPPEPTAGYKKIMVAQTGAQLSNNEVAQRILSAFARRAYRRPPTDAEISALVGFVKLAEQHHDDFETGLRVALKAVLVSPHFLFKVERDPPKAAPGEVYAISDLELATRLSYFLWSSMPDDELLRLAQFGELRQPGVLEKQVRRLLADPRSRNLAENFAGQWLQTRNLKAVPIDPKSFPKFDENLRLAMMEETTRFFDHVVREDRPITELLDGEYTFMNERMAKHYAIGNVKGEQFRKVSLAGTQRAGVLTHASVLTVNSNPTRTSPVKRGKFIIENILGATIPPPPPDVPDLDDEHELKGTLRQRLEQHRSNPNCASCHERMDPLGLAYEHFDGIGAWREKDGNQPIDASGTLPDGRKIKDANDLRGILKEKPDVFRRCLADKLLTYGLGRGLDYKDRCAMDGIVKQTAAGKDRFGVLVMAIVQSDPFQKRMCSKGSR